MSRSTAYAGSVLATKSGWPDIYVDDVTSIKDLYKALGYTIASATSSDPLTALKVPSSQTSLDQGASWNLDHDGNVDWHSRVRQRLGIGSGDTLHTSRSIAGSYSQKVMETVCGSYLSGSIKFWTPGDADIVFLQSGIGLDQDYDTSDGRAAPNAYDNLTMILATLEGGARTEITSGGTGSWANSSPSYEYSGGAGSAGGTGTWRYTTTAGDTMPIVYTDDGRGIDIAIGTFNGTDNGLSADTFGRPCIVRVDGVTHSTSPWATDNRVSLEATKDFGHRMVRLRNLGVGQRSVTLEAGTHAQANAIFAPDYWVQPIARPPIIVLLREMWLSDWAAGAPTLTDYNVVMGQLDAAVADNRAANPQSRVVVVDLGADFPNEIYWDSDKLHPEQSGFDWIADRTIHAMLEQLGIGVFA